jgi:hypothetical protein
MRLADNAQSIMLVLTINDNTMSQQHIANNTITNVVDRLHAAAAAAQDTASLNYNNGAGMRDIDIAIKTLDQDMDNMTNPDTLLRGLEDQVCTSYTFHPFSVMTYLPVNSFPKFSQQESHRSCHLTSHSPQLLSPFQKDTHQTRDCTVSALRGWFQWRSKISAFGGCRLSSLEPVTGFAPSWASGFPLLVKVCGRLWVKKGSGNPRRDKHILSLLGHKYASGCNCLLLWKSMNEL